MITKYFKAILLAFALAGCSTVSISDLEKTEISTGEKIRLETRNMWLIGRTVFFFIDPVDVSVEKVNSTRIWGSWSFNPFIVNEELAIKPGFHTLTLSCTNNEKGKYSIRDKGKLSFEAVSGNRYEVSADEAYPSDGSECDFTIKEIPLAK